MKFNYEGGRIKINPIQFPYWFVSDVDIEQIPTPLNKLSVVFSVDNDGNLRKDRKIGTLFKVNTITKGQVTKRIYTAWKRPVQRETLDWDNDEFHYDFLGDEE